jgi:hypothetical protein
MTRGAFQNKSIPCIPRDWIGSGNEMNVMAVQKVGKTIRLDTFSFACDCANYKF